MVDFQEEFVAESKIRIGVSTIFNGHGIFGATIDLSNISLSGYHGLTETYVGGTQAELEELVNLIIDAVVPYFNAKFAEYEPPNGWDTEMYTTVNHLRPPLCTEANEFFELDEESY